MSNSDTNHQAEKLLEAMKRSRPNGNDDSDRENSPDDNPSDLPPILRIDPRHESREITPGDDADVEDFNFRDTMQLTSENLQNLRRFFQHVEQGWSEDLSELLKSGTKVRLDDVHQDRHNLFVASMDDPCCAAWIKLQNQSDWLLTISPNLVFAFIDRMLGGEPSPVGAVRRPMTDIECRLIRRVVDSFIKQIEANWPLCANGDLGPQIDRVERRPSPFSSTGANERVVYAKYSVSLFGVQGSLKFAVPITGIHHLAQQRNLQDNGLGPNQFANENTKSTVEQQVVSAPIELVVNLASSTIRTSDLLDLRVGDIIATETNSSTPLELSIQNVPKFNVKAGALQGKKAVLIDTVIDQDSSSQSHGD